ncbi:hypothetical protein HPP92_022894 [Vanilla planifolia]|uniref:Uncharacterized protein n=1 Tax=Vanilla planifolia TaxID=51239 RepID=A0A835PXE7_VANPL|nr:hypothetical protein HPP92_022894 [Vanilla planifolia]
MARRQRWEGSDSAAHVCRMRRRPRAEKGEQSRASWCSGAEGGKVCVDFRKRMMLRKGCGRIMGRREALCLDIAQESQLIIDGAKRGISPTWC